MTVETPTGLYTLNNAAGLLTSYAHTQSAKSWGDASTLPAAATQTFTIDAYVATSQGWQERKVSGSSTNPSYNSTTSTLRYRAWGRRIEQEQKTQVPGPKNNRYNLSLYRYNGDGQVVTKRDFWTERDDNYAINKWWQGKIDNFTEAKPNTRFVYSGGQLIAELTEAQAARDGQEAIEGTRYLAGTDGYAAGGGSVVAQAGETLYTLSQRVYGSSSYWYLLAAANGLGDPQAALTEGQSLQVPEVAVSRNDAGTFKPFNPSEALGPGVPVVPSVPASGNGCGQVGQLLMVVVAVIATVYTAGAVASALGVTGTTAAGGAASTFATGAAVLTGNTAGAVLTISSTATISMGTALAASAAIGGAVGSIASQAVGMATGNVQSFSWRGVATSALTAGFGAGLGAAAQSGALGATLQQNGLLRGAATGLGSGIVSGAANGFSWRQVASNVVGSVLGGYVGDKVGGALGQPLFDPLTARGQFGQQALTSFTGGMVSQAVSSGLMGNSRIDPVNALGDALGSALVGRWSGQHAESAAAELAERERVAAEARARRAAENGLGDISRIGEGLASAAYANAMADLENGTATFGLGPDAQRATVEALPESRRLAAAARRARSSGQASNAAGPSGGGGVCVMPAAQVMLQRSNAVPEMLANIAVMEETASIWQKLVWSGQGSHGVRRPWGEHPNRKGVERLMSHWRNSPEHFPKGAIVGLAGEMAAYDSGALDLSHSEAIGKRLRLNTLWAIYGDGPGMTASPSEWREVREGGLILHGALAAATNPIAAATALLSRGARMAAGNVDELAIARLAILADQVSAPLMSVAENRALAGAAGIRRLRPMQARQQDSISLDIRPMSQVANSAVRGSVAENATSNLFTNRVPEDAINLRPFDAWRPGLPGNRGKHFLYVVKEDGTLVISPRPRAGEWGHVDLAQGGPVLAAGEGTYWGGFKMIDNASGHYVPVGTSAKESALNAFRSAGYNVDASIYQPKVWSPKLNAWVKSDSP